MLGSVSRSVSTLAQGGAAPRLVVRVDAARLLVVCDGAAPRYRPRRPEQTLLYRVVQANLDAFLAHAREQYEKPLPAYVEKELRAFIACGVPSQGFAIARCAECGKRLIVPFSCKRRGACGSCITRRMCDAAAHLVNHVFPDVPIRQWVISPPFELRLLLARDSRVYGAITRIFAEEVLGWYARRAAELGIVAHARDARGAAVTALQRWGSSVNLHPHVHGAWADGVFTLGANANACTPLPNGAPLSSSSPAPTASAALSGARAVFHAIPAPCAADLELIVARIHERALRWLRRRGLVADEERFSNDRAAPSPLDVFSNAALGFGRLGHVEPHEIVESPALDGPGGRDGDDSEQRDAADTLEARFLPSGSGSRRAAGNGWSLHAGTTVVRGDRAALERLLRYFTRPPLAQARLFLLRDGRIAYELRKPWRRDQTHRIMTALELIGRIAALIPPPRSPLIRFHGCFAPNSSWRHAVVRVATSRTGLTDSDSARCEHDHELAYRAHGPPTASTTSPSPSTAPSPSPSPNSGRSADGAAILAPPAERASPATPDNDKGRSTPLTSPWRLDWAALLKRVHDIDALACDCGGKLRFVGLITDPVEAHQVLAKLGELREPVRFPQARARDPTDFDDF